MSFKRFKTRSAMVIFTFAVLSIIAIVPRVNAIGFTDVVFVVDESGSMAGEHAWIGAMVNSLEAGYLAADVGTGVDANRYGLVGFGTSSHSAPAVQAAHEHLVGGGDMGTDAQLATASGGLIASGGFEDGWQAIDFAMNNYTFRTDAVVNFILITDEDRDVQSGSTLTKEGMISALNAENMLLNAVVNYGFSDGGSNVALGVDSDGIAYLSDGFGGFTSSAGGVATSGFGTTKSNYIDVAWATGGAAWDLNKLRLGGTTATSFTNAFIDIKVQETVETQVPEPSTLLLLGSGLVGLGFVRRKFNI